METAKKSMNLDEKRFLETQAVNDREKIRNIRNDALAERRTEAEIKNIQAETILRETKAKGKLTDDDILDATMRLLAADPELPTKVAVAQVRAVAAQINKGEAAAQLKTAASALQQRDAAKNQP